MEGCQGAAERRRDPLETPLLLFFILSGAGWLWEVAFVGLSTGVLVNRGFLHGPWLPVYGVGGLLFLLLPRRMEGWTLAAACALPRRMEQSQSPEETQKDGLYIKILLIIVRTLEWILFKPPLKISPAATALAASAFCTVSYVGNASMVRCAGACGNGGVFLLPCPSPLDTVPFPCYHRRSCGQPPAPQQAAGHMGINHPSG